MAKQVPASAQRALRSIPTELCLLLSCSQERRGTVCEAKGPAKKSAGPHMYNLCSPPEVWGMRETKEGWLIDCVEILTRGLSRGTEQNANVSTDTARSSVADGELAAVLGIGI